jgi:hypothetical protein
MCNLYSITTNQAAIIALFRVINRYVGNLPPMPGVFPDYPAPVIRNTETGTEMVTMRWGMATTVEQNRPAGHQHPQRNITALAHVAQAGEPARGAVQERSGCVRFSRAIAILSSVAFVRRVSAICCSYRSIMVAPDVVRCREKRITTIQAMIITTKGHHESSIDNQSARMRTSPAPYCNPGKPKDAGQPLGKTFTPR